MALIMEYCEKGELFDHISIRGGLSDEMCRTLFE